MLRNKDNIDKKNKDAQLLLSHIEKLSKYSYELEEKREQSLIEQSSRMLEAFSVITAALGILLSIILQYIPSLSKYFVFISIINIINIHIFIIFFVVYNSDNI